MVPAQTLLRWFFHPLFLVSMVVICVMGMKFMQTRLRESKHSNEELIRHSSRERELTGFTREAELQALTNGPGGNAV